MSLSAVPAPRALRGGAIPSLTTLLGPGGAGHAGVSPTAFRKGAYEQFLAGDLGFGRYSRLKLDWTRLPPKASRFEPMDLRPWDSEAGPPAGLASLAETASGEALLEGQHRFASISPWDQLVAAGWREGLSLLWSAGQSAKPLGIRVTSPGGLVLEPILLDVGKGADASVFLRWDGSKEPGLHLTSLQGRVAEGARLKLVLLHQGSGTRHRISSSLRLGRDASVEVFCAWLGGRWTVARMGAELSAPGASWRETHLISTAGREHLDLDSQVRMAAKHTSSDIQVKTVADGDSRAVFTGNLLMESEAVQSEAFLSDHVLLLSKGTRADSIPGLEIKAADVKAAHAASVGQVDEEESFYLESRGLEPAQARRLIVVGFLKSLMERAPISFVPNMLDPILEAKVSP